MRLIINLLRGFRGHPSHPPMTDASIGAYTTGSLLVIAGWLGLLQEKLAWGGFLAIAVGLLLAVPTVLTGFVDFLQIPRGTGMRRTAHLHWVTMVSSTSCFLIAEAMLQRGLDEGVITTPAFLVTLLAFGLLFLGGWIGGTIVFVYGMRVQNEPPEHPALQALKPKYPPD